MLLIINVMNNKPEIIEALNTGHKASSVLRDVLEEIAEISYCPKSYGFEGRDTFSGCGKCIICISKDLFPDQR